MQIWSRSSSLVLHKAAPLLFKACLGQSECKWRCNTITATLFSAMIWVILLSTARCLLVWEASKQVVTHTSWIGLKGHHMQKRVTRSLIVKVFFNFLSKNWCYYSFFFSSTHSGKWLSWIWKPKCSVTTRAARENEMELKTLAINSPPEHIACWCVHCYFCYL